MISTPVSSSDSAAQYPEKQEDIPIPPTTTTTTPGSQLPSLPLSDIAEDLQQLILSFLPLHDVVQLAYVNREWHAIVNSNVLWRQLYLRDFPFVHDSAAVASASASASASTAASASTTEHLAGTVVAPPGAEPLWKTVYANSTSYWDSTVLGSNLTVKENGKLLVSGQKCSWQSMRINKPMTGVVNGRPVKRSYYWELKIEKLDQDDNRNFFSMVIGIEGASFNFTDESKLGGEYCMIGFQNATRGYGYIVKNGNTVHNKAYQNYSSAAAAGDVIGIKLEFNVPSPQPVSAAVAAIEPLFRLSSGGSGSGSGADGSEGDSSAAEGSRTSEGKLYFYRNKVFLGEAFKGIPGDKVYYPTVSVYHANEVRILRGIGGAGRTKTAGSGRSAGKSALSKCIIS